ncbi:hypothetical protein FIBSPDRAFT_463124 [Athelia psychrophila]|uniref:Uncharacterized protein n=1 Tax=Athelia psychrophila TaxID=1759441 RepID=A0A166LNZ2_9AGAM|nr:hypothetical protein FIBSPDRAFT_463124 [Fibularhizoctonia sp. CBS 109695]
MSAKKADAKPYTKAPEIQTLVTPIRFQRRRHLHSLKHRRIEHQKEQKMEFDVHIAKRVSGDKAKLAAVKASQSELLSCTLVEVDANMRRAEPSPHKPVSWAFAFAVVVSDNPMLFRIVSSARLHVPLETCSSFCVPMTLATLTSTGIEGHGGLGQNGQSEGRVRRL